MKGLPACVSLRCLVFLLVGAVAGTQTADGQLGRFRQLLFEMSGSRDKEAACRYTEVAVDIVESIRSDMHFRDRVTNEIATCAKTRYPPCSTEQQTPGPSQRRRDDWLYATMLLDCVSRAGPQYLLDTSRNLLFDPNATEAYKGLLWEKVLSQRIWTAITEPGSLAAYDKQVYALGMDLLDREDGFRFKFGERSVLYHFVRHLIEYEATGDLCLRPINRDKGLEIARRYIRDERFHFSQKQWYMELVAQFDPAVRVAYIHELRNYVGNPAQSARLRLAYAKKLVALDQMTEEQFQELGQELEQDVGGP